MFSMFLFRLTIDYFVSKTIVGYEHLSKVT